MPPKAPKRPRDLNQWAKRMVDIATGEVSDREPTPEEQGKDPAAVRDAQLAVPSFKEFSDRYNVPFDATRGGAETMYPEYRQKLAATAAAAK